MQGKYHLDWQWMLVIIVGVLLIAGSSIYTINVSWEKLSSGKTAGNLLKMLSEMFPPEFSVVRTLGKAITETVAMSIVATLLGLVIAFPLSFLAANNTAPNSTVRYLIRGSFNALRSIPELIMGVVFVAAVGFGILPGILALALSSIGMLGKFYSEAIEKVDYGLCEAIQSTGGSPFHVIIFGVIPQVSSAFIDYTLYRWEHNFRASSIVGLIGAGGLGFQLIASLRIMQYEEVSAIIIVIYILVQLVDGLGNIVRRRLTEGDQ